MPDAEVNDSNRKKLGPDFREKNVKKILKKNLGITYDHRKAVLRELLSTVLFVNKK